jgi:hypothetical protein
MRVRHTTRTGGHSRSASRAERQTARPNPLGRRRQGDVCLADLIDTKIKPNPTELKERRL